MKHTLLVVEDNKNLANKMFDYLLNNLNDVIEIIGIAENGRLAMNIIEETNPNIILLDLHIPEINGLQIIDKIKSKNNSIIIISGEISMINNVKIHSSHNIKKIYIKPFVFKDLVDSLKYICNTLDDEEVSVRIERLLSSFDFNKSSLGYLYLMECLVLAYHDSTLLLNVENKLFPLVAQNFGIRKIVNIKWTIQKTINSMLRYTDNNKIQKYFPYNKKPSLKLFLQTILDLVKRNNI